MTDVSRGTQPPRSHPYIPNATPGARRRMLDAIGRTSIDALYAAIPDHLRLRRPLDLPPALATEVELVDHVDGLLDRNTHTGEVVSFLGAGCYPHFVPEICNEINGRAEFLTAYAGEPYEDHGKWQALFEYASLMADLLEMDVVNVPTYDGYQAAATSLLMAHRITGRRRVVIAGPLHAAKRRRLETYVENAMEVASLEADEETGDVRLDALAGVLDGDVAVVYLETPNAFGVLTRQGDAVARAAHDAGALVVCSADPLSLGFQHPPARWGADIVCGDLQSLGLGMHFGGANGGFIAIHDDERFVFELPSRLFGLAPTAHSGEIGFCDVAYERTSLADRAGGVEWVGTAAALWGITAGVYLALVGPRGLAELGDLIASRTRHAMERLASIPGIDVHHSAGPHWREFVVSFAGLDVASVNDRLREAGIYGGADITGLVPRLGAASVYCVTELHDVAAIERLARRLEEIVGG